MSKATRYVQLLLSAWPQVRDIIQRIRNKPVPHDSAVAAGVAALAMIIDELDQVESGKRLAKEAHGRVQKITETFNANDAAIDKLIREKFGYE